MASPSSSLNLIFLGTSTSIQVPSFHCDCKVCEELRNHPNYKRTRSAVALRGEETLLIDCGPDIEFQLEREGINTIDHIFITHWHYDHCWGLGFLGDIPRMANWSPVHVYLPTEVVPNFKQIYSYVLHNVIIHAVQVGDRITLADGTIEVVKTTHTPHSVGYIFEGSSTFAYLVDSIIPPQKTIDRIINSNIDFIILEGTVDELIPAEGEKWTNFSISEAIAFWHQTNIKECILTHLSNHKWIRGQLLPGLSIQERKKLEQQTTGLRFAYDGMEIKM